MKKQYVVIIIMSFEMILFVKSFFFLVNMLDIITDFLREVTIDD